jgi:hypothetical protein
MRSSQIYKTMKSNQQKQLKVGSLLVPRRGFVLQVTSTIASLFWSGGF